MYSTTQKNKNKESLTLYSNILVKDRKSKIFALHLFLYQMQASCLTALLQIRMFHNYQV